METTSELAPVTLAQILATFSPGTVTLLGTADAAVVRGCKFYDSAEEFDLVEGEILLIPSSAQFTNYDLLRLAESAAAAGCAALALKVSSERTDEASDISSRTGLSVLVVDQDVNWKLFDAVISQALGEMQHDGALKFDHLAEPLFALANELAEFFGGSVAIEDLGRNILAYSSIPGQLIDPMRTYGILTRKVPASPFNETQYREVLSTDSVVTYPQIDDELPRFAIAIRAGSIPLGTIWAIDRASTEQPDQDPVPSAEAVSTLHKASEIAAADMLNDIRVRQAGAQPREKRLRDMLSGAMLTGSEFAELGIPNDAHAALMGFFLSGNHPRTRLVHTASILGRQLLAHHAEAVTAVYDREIYALVRADSLHDAQRIANPLVPIVKKLAGVDIRVCIPGLVSHPSGVASARTLVRSMHEAIQTGTSWSMNEHSVITIEEVRPQLLIRAARAALDGAEYLRDPDIDRLITQAPDIAATVAEYIHQLGNVAATAGALHIHENTVRYRIRQAREKYRVDLANADTHLAVWLQLKMEV